MRIAELQRAACQVTLQHKDVGMSCLNTINCETWQCVVFRYVAPALFCGGAPSVGIQSALERSARSPRVASE